MARSCARRLSVSAKSVAVLQARLEQLLLQ